MLCIRLLNYILNNIIIIKLYVVEKCCKKKLKNNLIKSIKLKSNQVEIIKNSNQIKKLINNGWYSIKHYNTNITMVDIEYYYNDEIYNVIFKYPNTFQFPLNFKTIDFDNKILTLTDMKDNNVSNIFDNYKGPNNDFYINNNIKFSINDICVLNNLMTYQENNLNFKVTFFNLDEYIIEKNKDILNYLKTKTK